MKLFPFLINGKKKIPLDSDKSLGFQVFKCLEKVKYFTEMAVGPPGIPREGIVSASERKNDRVTALLKALFHRCVEYRNLCTIK